MRAKLRKFPRSARTNRGRCVVVVPFLAVIDVRFCASLSLAFVCLFLLLLFLSACSPLPPLRYILSQHNSVICGSVPGSACSSAIVWPSAIVGHRQHQNRLAAWPSLLSPFYFFFLHPVLQLWCRTTSQRLLLIVPRLPSPPRPQRVLSLLSYRPLIAIRHAILSRRHIVTNSPLCPRAALKRPSFWPMPFVSVPATSPCALFRFSGIGDDGPPFPVTTFTPVLS